MYLSNKIQVIHFITLQDRPERSKSTGHGYHNATHNTRWGWSSVFNQRMISCNKCLKYCIQLPSSGKSMDCTTCYDWNANKVNIQLPLDYPGNRKRKKCEKIDFESMKKAVNRVQQNRNKWSHITKIEYLKVEGLNLPLIMEILQCKDNDEVQEVLPPVWSTEGDMCTHIDTIMHQIFLGITNTIGMLFKKVLSKFSMFKTFQDCNNLKLKTIRGLQLNWCKSWGFGSKKTPFGPWVSENFLAYARLFKHMYVALNDIKDKSIRTLSKRIVESFMATVSRIMQNTVNEKLLLGLDRHVKLFLTYLCKLEVIMNEQKGTPNKKLKVDSMSNFSGLMNLTSYMRDYGPLRLYWEGGFKGEALLKYIKPMVKQGIHKKAFAENTLTLYYKDRFLQNILKVDLKDDEKEGNEKANVRYGNFCTYNSIEKIEECVAECTAISVIILQDNRICISFMEDKIHKLNELITNDDNGKWDGGTYVTTISLGAKTIIDKKELREGSYVNMWGLALPLNTNSNGVQQYYITTHTWKERVKVRVGGTTKAPEFLLPRVDDCYYPCIDT